MPPHWGDNRISPLYLMRTGLRRAQAAWPGVAVPTTLGDAVAIDERCKHAAIGGGGHRRMCTPRRRFIP